MPPQCLCDCNSALYVYKQTSPITTDGCLQSLYYDWPYMCICLSVSSRYQSEWKVISVINKRKALHCSLQNDPSQRQKASVLQLLLPSACAGLKIGSFTPSCIAGMRFAVLTGRADCHYLCLTSLPSDVSMLAYFNNISCCCRSRCYRDANFQIG